jgi:hypothetical protein
MERPTLARKPLPSPAVDQPPRHGELRLALAARGSSSSISSSNKNNDSSGSPGRNGGGAASAAEGLRSRTSSNGSIGSSGRGSAHTALATNGGGLFGAGAVLPLRRDNAPDVASPLRTRPSVRAARQKKNAHLKYFFSLSFDPSFRSLFRLNK